MTTPPQPPAGWYPNPQGPGQRYWDGTQWTEHLHPPAQPAQQAQPETAAQTAAPQTAKPATTRFAQNLRNGWDSLWGLPMLAKAGIAAGLVLFIIVAATTSPEEEDKSTPGTQAGSTTKPKPATPTAVIDFASPTYGAEVQRDNVTVRGTVRPPNARLRIDGKLVPVKPTGAWKHRLRLHRGTNTFPVVVAAPGFTTKNTELVLDRVLSASERREIAAARREKRRQAAEARREKFKADSIEIPYNQLNKNPERYAGKKVVYTGKILQIQEEGDQGFMLLSVTNEGYDIWTDNVWVNYFRAIDSAEEDILKIYGVVKGSRSYETQIGGETYVPEIDARYIEE